MKLYDSIVDTLKRVGNNKKKGHKMSKQTKTNIKIIGLVISVVGFAVGASVVGLPSLSQSDVVSLAYFGIGGGLLFWLIGKNTK